MLWRIDITIKCDAIDNLITPKSRVIKYKLKYANQRYTNFTFPRCAITSNKTRERKDINRSKNSKLRPKKETRKLIILKPGSEWITQNEFSSIILEDWLNI